MSAFPVIAVHFKLQQRAIHVFSKAVRVHRFMNLLERVSGQTDNEIGAKLGELMNQSQESCSYDYDCSCSEPNQLYQVAQDEGFYGSRLTGAGWGGCSVHLIAVDQISDMKHA
jgi:galactokinase